MITDDITGSDIANEMGWNESTMLVLFSEFVCQEGADDRWLAFLHERAEVEKVG